MRQSAIEDLKIVSQLDHFFDTINLRNYRLMFFNVPCTSVSSCDGLVSFNSKMSLMWNPEVLAGIFMLSNNL